jgi:hypothetical protein
MPMLFLSLYFCSFSNYLLEKKEALQKKTRCKFVLNFSFTENYKEAKTSNENVFYFYESLGTEIYFFLDF